jgi:hypothetical protein
MDEGAYAGASRSDSMDAHQLGRERWSWIGGFGRRCPISARRFSDFWTTSIQQEEDVMTDCAPLNRRYPAGRSAWLVTGIFLVVSACSSEQPKPMAQPTPDQVRSHADKAFEKLKQEEQERSAQPPVPR